MKNLRKINSLDKFSGNVENLILYIVPFNISCFAWVHSTVRSQENKGFFFNILSWFSLGDGEAATAVYKQYLIYFIVCNLITITSILTLPKMNRNIGVFLSMGMLALFPIYTGMMALETSENKKSLNIQRIQDYLTTKVSIYQAIFAFITFGILAYFMLGMFLWQKYEETYFEMFFPVLIGLFFIGFFVTCQSEFFSTLSPLLQNMILLGIILTSGYLGSKLYVQTSPYLSKQSKFSIKIVLALLLFVIFFVMKNQMGIDEWVNSAISTITSTWENLTK